MKIATEEAFTTPELVKGWNALLNAGAPAEPGLPLLAGVYQNLDIERSSEVATNLADLGAGRIAHMDEAGVDMQVIFITAPGVQVFDADTGCGLAENANDILAEAVNNHPTRFAGLAAIAPQAPQRAAQELERSVGLGLKGAVVNSHTKGQYLDAPEFWPILEAAESLDVPIYIHPRESAPAMLTPFAERHLEKAMWGFQTETGLHALRMIVSGVFDKFPKLQIGLGHLGEGIPFWLDRQDRFYLRYRQAPDTYPHFKAEHVPSKYFLENFFVTTSGHNWDPALRFVEEVIGEDRLLFAVDYPYENCVQQTEQAGAVTVKNPDKFYHLNAKKFFKLD
ncbi:MAG: amidohydrolase [Rhodospirillaceae bacterium]|nr:amidohydrolase [Rhodospirillaceae bacterium]